ncbi:zinc-binding dehydrogenase [Sphingobacterium sp. BIGb0165]|uniref:zinc-binding dehydrogenase n=1 Tax=Sphingobacterium sp. BIGb0165 TaxID=2940615 RepID=UPI002168A89F|nr:zinc-binding dehydrogenase [Sphingobacterium sp. BIGb0165]MCS4226464.1 putative phosphonate catabolism associated alcohol dehydrogenase [Sphingobacterium sp. BIGb0165]
MKKIATYYVFSGANTALVKVEQPIPELNAGEILVRIRYTTLCGSDLHTYCGLRNEPSPTILGHEIVGVVEDISPSHSGLDAQGNSLHIGDLITWTVFSSDPSTGVYQSETPQKNDKLYKYGHRQITEEDNLHGGLATHIILRPHTCLRILPKDISLAVAATINCAVATSAGALRLAGTITGKNIHIAGIGLLGLVSIAMCRELGAKNIIASDINPARLAMAKSFGASHTIDLSETEESTLLQDISVDRFIDMSGSPEAMELGIETLALHGSAILVGAVFNQRKTGIDAEKAIRKMLTIKGLHNYNYTDFSNAVDFIIENWQKYPFTSLIEREFPLEEVNAAINYALTQKPIRAGLAIYTPITQI